MKGLVLLAAGVIFTGCIASFAQTPSASGAVVSRYEAMLARLKSGDTKIDYGALRLAYSETKDALPAGADHGVRQAMTTALLNKKYPDFFKMADEILKTTYLSPETHAALSTAYRETGDVQKAEFHKAVYLGLINSILATGDGKTTETAYTVITIEEEYTVMRALGYSVWNEVMGVKGGHNFNLLSGTNETTHETVIMYFNIDTPKAMQNRKNPQP